MALGLALVAVLVALASAAAAFAPKRHAFTGHIDFILLGLAGLLALVAGIAALVQATPAALTLPFGLPWLRWHVRLDALSGFFLTLIGLLLTAVSLYGPGYVRDVRETHPRMPVLGLFTGLFAAGLLLVVLADDAFGFMIAWELMSVASYFLVTLDHEQETNRRAGFLYLLMAHVGALAILLSFGVMAGHVPGDPFGAAFSFEALRAAQISPLWASIAFGLALFGFGMKAGMLPLHAWLPEAHPAAPSHISALMSGVMLKVAIYGLIRVTYDLLGDVQWQWGLAMLLIGAGSALFGVLYALVQDDLKRLLAYSSIENIGIVLIGLGLSVIFLSTGHKALGVLGLLAALYHALNHAAFKGLLFLGAGAVLHATGSTNLNHLGGLLRTMPYTAAFMLVGALAISGLPPLNGFVSEWLTFQVALQATQLESGVLRVLIPATAAMLALAAALSAATFVKVIGVGFLGAPRSDAASQAHDANRSMRLGLGLLASACILLGILPTLMIKALASVPELLIGQGPVSAGARGWLWLTPISPKTASYSAPLVILGVALVVAIGTVVLRRVNARQRRAYPWECGFGQITTRMEYSATAFAMPVRRIFNSAWDVNETVDETKQGEPPRTLGLRYALRLGDRAWPRVYEPLGRAVLAAARRVGGIQTGSIHTYLIYSFATLLILLWVVT